MKTLTIVLMIFVLGNYMEDQPKDNKSLDSRISSVDYLEKERCTFLQNHFGVVAGSKTNKVRNKRIVALGTQFGEIPFQCAFSGYVTHFSNDHRVERIDDTSKQEKVRYEGIDTQYECYSLEIILKNSLPKKHIGYMGVIYTNSEYLARRIFVGEVAVKTSRLFNKEDFTRPEGIGDDYCFKTKSQDRRSRIHFIRDYTVFSIEIDDTKAIDIEKFAQYIDQKFVELNKRLNEPKERTNK
jgi:hypothetical protein